MNVRIRLRDTVAEFWEALLKTKKKNARNSSIEEIQKVFALNFNTKQRCFPLAVNHSMSRIQSLSLNTSFPNIKSNPAITSQWHHVIQMSITYTRADLYHTHNFYHSYKILWWLFSNTARRYVECSLGVAPWPTQGFHLGKGSWEEAKLAQTHEDILDSHYIPTEGAGESHKSIM